MVARMLAGRLGLLLAASAVALVAWVAFLELFDVSPLVGKSPSAVWEYLFSVDDASANRDAVFSNLGTTLRDTAAGFTVGLFAGGLIAVLFVLVSGLEQAFMPVAMMLRSVPLVAMTPIIVLIFGRGLGGVAVVGAIVVFFPVLVNMVFGMRSASARSTELVVAYGGGTWTILRKVALPSALPALFASARISVPTALTGALIAEWLATGEGIGGAIMRASGGFRYDELWASVVVVTGTAIILYTLVSIAEAAVLARFGQDAESP